MSGSCSLACTGCGLGYLVFFCLLVPYAWSADLQPNMFDISTTGACSVDLARYCSSALKDLKLVSTAAKLAQQLPTSTSSTGAVPQASTEKATAAHETETPTTVATTTTTTPAVKVAASTTPATTTTTPAASTATIPVTTTNTTTTSVPAEKPVTTSNATAATTPVTTTAVTTTPTNTTAALPATTSADTTNTPSKTPSTTNTTEAAAPTTTTTKTPATTPAITTAADVKTPAASEVNSTTSTTTAAAAATPGATKATATATVPVTDSTITTTATTPANATQAAATTSTAIATKTPATKDANTARRSLLAVVKEMSSADVLNTAAKRLNMQLPATGSMLYGCLRGVIRNSKYSIDPDAGEVTPECLNEVHSFEIARAQDVRTNIPFLKRCGLDLTELCANASATDTFDCFKAKKRQLRPSCAAAVTVWQKAAAGNLGLDPSFHAACKADLDKLCPDARLQDGEAQLCLERVEAGLVLGSKLAPACSRALFQRHLEEGEDIRFNFALSSACTLDKQMFCHDVQPGNGQVLKCLEHFKKEPTFSEPCQLQLDRYMTRKSLDVRLDFQFRQQCGSLAKSFCSVDLAAGGSDLEEGERLMECMRMNLDRISYVPCKQVVYAHMIEAFQDNRLDASLVRACRSEVQTLCRNPRTSLMCLKPLVMQESPSGNVSRGCAEVVVARLREAAADVSFNPALVRDCAAERLEYCSSTSGSEEILCLADNRQHHAFSAACRAAVMSSLVEMSSDVRLFHGLRQGCADDIRALCKGVHQGEGRVVDCLQTHRSEINSTECKRHMLRFVGLVVEDPRMDHQLMQACSVDAQKFCAGVSGAPLHACLRASEDHLSQDCRAAEARLEAFENEDVRINPKITGSCGSALSTYCRDEKPGNANLLRCLQMNMQVPDFPVACKTVMSTLLDRASVKYSLNAKLREACDADLAEVCPAEGDSSNADASALTCLTSNVTKLGTSCQRELSVLVRYQFLRYRMGMPLTMACDGDVLTWCHVDQLSSPYLESGYVFDCLVQHFNQLHRPCWALISIFDVSVYAHATKLESQASDGVLGGRLRNEDLVKISSELRRELEPKILHHMMTKVVKTLEKHYQSVTPALNMLMHGAGLLFLAFVATFIVLIIVYSRKSIKRGVSVIKDGRV